MKVGGGPRRGAGRGGGQGWVWGGGGGGPAADQAGGADPVVGGGLDLDGGLDGVPDEA